MKLALVFFALSATAGTWASINGAWQAVAVSIVLCGIGVYVHRYGRKANDEALKAEIERIRHDIEAMRGQMELYGMSKDV